MPTPKKKSRKAKVTVKDLKAKKNPKAGSMPHFKSAIITGRGP